MAGQVGADPCVSAVSYRHTHVHSQYCRAYLRANISFIFYSHTIFSALAKIRGSGHMVRLNNRALL